MATHARRWLGATLLAATLTFTGSALASNGAAGLGPAGVAAQEADAGAARIRRRTVRPPEGSVRRGRWPVPAWVLYLAGGGTLALGLGALAWSIRRRPS